MANLVLADDNLTIQKVIELTFREDDIRVHTFSHGTAALEYVRSQPVDILLTDVSLPLVDGYELCREVKHNPATAHVPVVLLAGTFEPFDEVRAERAGSDARLTKPFETTQLAALVRQLLADSKAAPEKVAAEAGSPPGFVFKLPTGPKDPAPVFSLRAEQCHLQFSALARDAGREIAPQQPPVPEAPVRLPLSEEEVDRLIRLVIERLPGELRRLIPEVARDVGSSRNQAS